MTEIPWFPQWFPLDDQGVMPQWLPTTRDRYSFTMMAEFADRRILEERMVSGWRGHWKTQSGKMAYECPEHNCYFKVGLRGPDSSIEHQCPYKGETKVSWSVAKTLLEIVWGQFDDTIDWIKSHDDGTTTVEMMENHKGQARAYSRMLAVFMVPQFTDENEIAKEGVKRWKKRQAGEEYDTPGLGHRRYEGPPSEEIGVTPDASRHIPGRKPRVAHKLTPGEVTQLKAAKASGLFDNSDLAVVYKVSEETVVAILAD